MSKWMQPEMKPGPPPGAVKGKEDSMKEGEADIMSEAAPAPLLPKG